MLPAGTDSTAIPSRLSLTIRIALVWLAAVGVLFVVGSFKRTAVGATTENYLSFLLGITELVAAYLVRKRRKWGVLLAGCGLALLTVVFLKMSDLQRDLARAVALALAICGVPFVLGLLRWRELH